MSRHFYLWLCTICLLGFGCGKKEQTPAVVDVFLSKDPSFLFHLHHKNQFVSQINNNDFWKQYFKYYPNGNVQNLLRSLPEDKDIWVAYTHSGVYLWSPFSQKDTLSPWRNTTLDRLDSLSIEQKKWYYIRKNDQIIISSLKDISFPETPLKASFADFHKVAQTTSAEVPANLFMNAKKNREFIGGLFPQRLVKELDKWTAWDIFLENNTLRLGGSALRPADSLPQLPLISAKKNTDEAFDVIPAQATEVRVFAFEEMLVPTELYFDFQEDITSVGFFSFQGDSLATLRSLNPEETLRYFTILKTDTYQGNPLYQIEELSDISSFFSIFDANLQPKYLYKDREHLVFAQQKEALEGVINAVQSKNTLSERKAFASLQEKNASQTALTAIANLQELSSFKKKYPSLAEKFAYASLQISSQDEFYLLSLTATAQKQGGKAIQNQEEGSSERFEITLDREAHTTPKFVTNHRSGKREIVIQDVENQLYLIGNDGKILWKKRLDAPIVGEVYQVDLFQNGFLQLAFNTEHSFWVIDRNGKEVAPFPLSYKENLLPLQIFDYDQHKDYRFVVCSEHQIRLLDKKGNPIKGFEYAQVPNGLRETPEHFRIAGKDFIVFPQRNGTLSLLQRNGKDRMTPSRKFDFSDNPIFAYKDYFVFTTKAGELFYIDMNGGIRTETLAPSATHFFTATKDKLVILSGNELTIGKKRIELPYAQYGRPVVHSLPQGQALLSFLDEQNNRLYVMNMEGESLAQFPIYALSQGDITVESGQHLLVFLKEKNVVCVRQW